MADENDYSDRYNTPIPPERQAEWEAWLKKTAEVQKRNPLNDLYDYDVQGFFLNGEGFAENGHGSDRYKKPNHPTFSDQSQYHGVDGHVGGRWAGENGAFEYHPSATNLKMRSLEDLQAYFDEVEPGVKLIIPQQEKNFEQLWDDKYGYK